MNRILVTTAEAILLGGCIYLGIANAWFFGFLGIAQWFAPQRALNPELLRDHHSFMLQWPWLGMWFGMTLLLLRLLEARRAVRHRCGQCPACGYPVGRGAAGPVCTECGTALPKASRDQGIEAPSG